MGLVERIRTLCNQRNITIAELERQLDIANSSIRKWDNQSPSSERLRKVADYFGVTTDYLLGRTNTPEFTRKNELDVQKVIDQLIEGLSDTNQLAYLKNGGEELDEEAAELLRDSLERTARRAKLLAKEKFTRNDLRKNNDVK